MIRSDTTPILQRTTSLADLAANTAGIALALMLIWLLGLRRQ